VSSDIMVAHYTYPVIELASVVVRFDQTVEDMIAGMLNNNPDITSANFAACRGGRKRRAKARLFLAKPLHDREHVAMEEVLRRLGETGFVPEGLPQLAALKEHADELWAAGVPFVGGLASDSAWQGPDGSYAPYFILNPEDRGFHLHWLEGDWGGPTWFVVSREERQPAGGRES
jgi:hypothetical protein